MLAMVDWHNPIIWAIIIGWIMSVVLHEFAHGIVGYLGGDYTVRERGGLTLNPLQYIDPVFSIVMPVIFLMLGGVPLPGGVTYIRNDLLRSRAWESAVSLAGPAMNFLLAILLALPLHPRFHWAPDEFGAMTTAQVFMGAMAWLQMLSVIFNLVPIPPLDGYGAVSPMLDPQTRQKIDGTGRTLFFIYFLILWQVPHVFQYFHGGVARIFTFFGFDTYLMAQSYNFALFGRTN